MKSARLLIAGAATAVLLGAGGGAAFATSATGTVQGTITDANGHPVGQECLQLVPAGSSYGTYRATTSNSGNYQILSVAPGTYNLEVGCFSGNQYAPVWYHNAPTAQSATPINVSAGTVSTATLTVS